MHVIWSRFKIKAPDGDGEIVQERDGDAN